MIYYGENPETGHEENGTVYHAGNGFYNPYVEPAWVKEKRSIREEANGIGFAALGYIAISSFTSAIYLIFIRLFYPAANIHGNIYVTEATEWLFTLAVYIASLLIPFGIYALCIKMPLKVALPFRKAKIDLTAGGVLVGLGTTVLASYVTGYIQMAFEAIGIGLTMPEYEVPKTALGIVLYFIVLAVAPAFIEEMIFRGIVMQSLRRYGDIFALVSSALLFGIFHLNMIQMPYAFILGLCIGYFVMRTGSLWVGVIIHFINNGAAVVFELMMPYMSEETFYLANIVYNFVFVILAVIAIALILAKYKDIFRFEPSKSEIPSGKRILYFVTAPALAAALAAAVVLTIPYLCFI